MESPGTAKKSKETRIIKLYEEFSTDGTTRLDWMQVDDKPRQQVDTRPSTSCANPTCPNTSENVKDLFYCSRCKGRKYCGPICQKQDWKRHKDECVCLLAHRHHQAAKSPALMEMDSYRAVLRDSLLEELTIAAYSALRLYRADTIYKTHFIFIRVSYTPPQTPVAFSDVIGVRGLFKFKDAKVLAIEDAPGTEDDGVKHLNEQRAEWQKLGFECYFVMIQQETDAFILPNPTHTYDIIQLPVTPECPNVADINPKWEQYVEKCFARKKWHKSQNERLFDFCMDDWTCFESKEAIRYLRDQLQTKLGVQSRE